MLASAVIENYSLPPDEVHIWRTRSDLSYDRISHLQQLLSVDEKQRIDRFSSEQDRNRHTIARGLLRLVLSRLSQTAPELLEIGSSVHGKPHLLQGAHQPRLDFNISHSGEFVYVALANGRAVGVDVEHVQKDIPVEMIAKSFFSATEFNELMAIDSAMRLESFFACWTRKEAFLKATGKGLLASSNPCSQPLFGCLPMPVIIENIEANSLVRWTLLDLNPDAGYKAALVFEGTGCRVINWNWPAFET